MNAETLAAALLNLAWESSLAAAVLGGLVVALRLRSPRLRHLVWSALLVKCVVPGTFLVWAVEPVETALRPHVPVAVGAIPLARAWMVELSRLVVPVAPDALANGWAAAVVAVWSIGAVALLVRTAVAARGTAHVVAASEHVGSGRLADALARAMAAGGTSTRVRLALSPRASSAFVWGPFRPVIVLPASLADVLSDRELEAVLLHEVAHVRRHDVLTACLSGIVCCLAWPHPLVRWLARASEREREFACDLDASLRARSPRDLACGLAKAVQVAVSRTPAATPAMAAGDVARRLGRLVAPPPAEDQHWRRRALVAGSTVLFLLLAVGSNPCLR